MSGHVFIGNGWSACWIRRCLEKESLCSRALGVEVLAAPTIQASGLQQSMVEHRTALYCYTGRYSTYLTERHLQDECWLKPRIIMYVQIQHISRTGNG